MAGREKSTRIVKKLKQTEERYRELFDSINVCVAVYKAKNDGEDFIIKDFNTAAENVEKVSRREIIGKSILAVFPGIKDFGILEVMQRVWKTEVPERFPVKLYKNNKIIGWRDNYIYKLPSGDIVDVYEDVTERKKGEEALNEAEQRYKIVADFTYDWEFWSSPEGKMLYVSPACERITGYTPTQFIKDPRLINKIVIPEDKSIRAAHLDRIKDIVSDIVIYRIKRKDGDIRWIEHICRPVLDGKGTFLGTRGSNRDITDRKQAEEKLEESEEKYRLLVENLNEGIWQIDQDAFTTYVNAPMGLILGYTAEQMLGKHLFDFMDKRGVEIAQNNLQRRQQGIKEQHDFEFIRKDGSRIYASLETSPITDADGKYLGAIAGVQDITERKKAQDALNDSEAKFRSIVEQSTDVVFTTDATGTLTFLSPETRRTFGFEPHEMVGRHFNEFLAPDNIDKATAAFTEVLTEKGEGGSIELAMKREDGSIFLAELRGGFLRYGNSIGIAGTIRDVTALKEAEHKRRESEERFTSAFNINPDPVAITEIDTGRIITVNPAYEKWSGFSRAELTGATTKELNFWVRQEDRNRIVDQLQRNGEVSDVEVQFRRKNGNISEILFSVKFIEISGKKYLFSRAHDITERKLLEQLLRESEEKYRTVFENAGEAIYVAVDNRIVFANKRSFEILQYSKEELFGRPFSDFVYPDDRDMVENRYLASIQGETIEPVVTLRFVNKDGSIRWLETRSTTIEWEGKPASLNFAADVTARKVAEEALEQVNREQAAIIDFLPDATFAIDNDRKVVFWNRALENMTGVMASAMIGKGDYAYTVPFYGEARPVLMDLIWEDREEVRSRYSNITNEDNAFATEVFCPALYKGKGAWVFAKASPLYDRDGKIVGAIESVRDITPIKQMGEDLRHSEEQYRLLAENAEDVIWTTDPELNFTYISPSVLKLRGLEPKEAMRQTLEESMTPESLQTVLHELEVNRLDIEAGIDRSVRLKIEQYHKEGTTVWVEVIVRPLYDNTGQNTGFIGVSRDITERVKAEEKLNTSEQKYRLLAENSADVIWTVDTNFIYTYVSPSIFRLRGLKPEEIIGQPMISTMTPQSQQILAEQWGVSRNAIQKGTETAWRGEIHAPRKDGSMVWTEVVVKTLHDDNGRHIGFIGVSRDISERKATDEALRESQAKYYELLENAGEAILIAQDGLVKFINSRLTELTGYSAAEYLNTPFVNFIHKDDMDMVSSKYATRMRGEEVESNYVFRVIHRDGHIVWVEIHAALATWEGRPASLNFLTDITERRKAEEALIKSESRYKLLEEFTDDVVWVLDRDLHLTYVSRSIRKLRGVEPEEAMQEEFASIMTPQSLQKIRHLLKVNLSSIEEGKDGSARIEIEQYRKDRSIIWVELNMKELRDNTGKFIGFTGTSRDITARKASEQAIRESEEKFRNIFEQSKDAIFIIDKDINVLDVNDSLCTLTGYSKDELLSENFIPTQNARKMFRSLIEKTGSLRDYEYTLHRKDGALISVLISASVRTDKAGNILGYQGIIHDITEHKRLDEERQKTARLESIGTLAGGIAHDFNNILGAIIGNISLAKTEIPPGHGAHDLMKDAEKAVMRAKELTRQLLTFARGGAPVKKRIQLRSTIMDTASFTTRGTNVRCRFSIADDLRPADVDEGQISQVIQNLVLNARQAMPTGGDIDITSENIALTEEMRLGRRLPLSPGIYIRITVKDNGVGIKPEHLERIFDPYFTTKQSGSGLGLATCYSIVRNHGGHISVDSSPDRGSTFYVYLPASEGRTGHAGKEETKEAIHMNGRILVMDDEAALRTTISNMLKRLGFEHVEVAANGEEALDLYEKALQAKQPFDVVILDLTVPGGMGGKETMEKLRKADPGVVAIVSSGYANEAIMADYINYGFKGVIVKPYTFDELKSTLHELINSLKNN